MGSEFTFHDYVDEAGNSIRRWLDGPARAVKAKFNIRLEYLEATPHGQWVHSLVETLTEGECHGLFEVRARKGHVQYRILAYHGPFAQEPTLLLGIIKGGARVPLVDCIEAHRIRAIVEDEPNARRETHDFNG